MTTSTAPLRIAMIGTGFMGRMHTQAWLTAPRFFDLARTPEPVLLVGRDAPATAPAAARLGWPEHSTDWRTAVDRDDIDVVDICTPGDTHAEIALAALEAGKHVLCEKPLANSVAEAQQMTDAAAAASERSGAVAMCGFSYRRTPALALARQLVAEGRIGEIRHVRAQYLQDWLADADSPHTWRLDRERAGSGALGDIGAHSIDTAQWLVGRRIAAVSAQLRTFVPTRPRRSAVEGLGGAGDDASDRLPVTVDDAAAFTARFGGGALGVFEATRMATGRRNANRIEINGDRGSIAFDFERMNELEVYDAAPDSAQGFRRVQVTEAQHPYAGAWWPAGHGLGYEHLFTHQAVDFVRAVTGGTAASPGFAEAMQVQRVLAAVEQSAAHDSILTSVEGNHA
ncbi:Gfo/Idh/MocA family protein [Microbacterium radiodurans]|uniref:Gfo/Idh/MocA family oxidoreductase n=1 Tax=Microbacterium radiodurans TaxID=661398 RepID=A0A5J5IT37_9MICO|nr:Gfo/Idh/MocA family oxidoreductase [Microbacterium radiodurans]KAA9089117.1 Gfo/Idh/MocA family oxidoreductase [Microbacterium radiodurans]